MVVEYKYCASQRPEFKSPLGKRINEKRVPRLAYKKKKLGS